MLFLIVRFVVGTLFLYVGFCASPFFRTLVDWLPPTTHPPPSFPHHSQVATKPRHQREPTDALTAANQFATGCFCVAWVARPWVQVTFKTISRRSGARKSVAWVARPWVQVTFKTISRRSGARKNGLWFLNPEWDLSGCLSHSMSHVIIQQDWALNAQPHGIQIFNVMSILGVFYLFDFSLLVDGVWNSYLYAFAYF